MSLRLLENAPLAGLNTFGVAARARRLVMLEDERDLPQALAGEKHGIDAVLQAVLNMRNRCYDDAVSVLEDK